MVENNKGFIIPQPVEPPNVIITKAQPIEELQPIEVEKPKPKNDLADLFSVPAPEDNDIYVDDLLEIPEEGSYSDLTDVSKEDIIGKPRAKRYKRTNKRYIQPSSLGGMQG